MDNEYIKKYANVRKKRCKHDKKITEPDTICPDKITEEITEPNLMPLLNIKYVKHNIIPNK